MVEEAPTNKKTYLIAIVAAIFASFVLFYLYFQVAKLLGVVSFITFILSPFVVWAVSGAIGCFTIMKFGQRTPSLKEGLAAGAIFGFAGGAADFILIVLSGIGSSVELDSTILIHPLRTAVIFIFLLAISSFSGAIGGLLASWLLKTRTTVSL